MTPTPDSTDQIEDEPAPAPFATDREGWLARIEEIGEEAGYFQPLGARHWAFFMDESPTLLVTFETVDAIRARSDGLPMGHALAKMRGWSHLCLIADGDTWYRDPAIYRYFDRLVDDAFFEDFDRTILYGSGMGAYAACAYSVAAPGATVLAVRPVATLDPAVAGWDTRFLAQRRLCFTDRYGFAPDMTEGAGDVFVFYDPEQRLDAMHAALFARPHVTPLRCRHLGSQIERALAQMQILPAIIAAAGDGNLNPALFARFYRQRRRHMPYLREVMAQLDGADRTYLTALLARNVTARLQAPRFRRRLADLLAQGIVLPPEHGVGQP